MLRWWLLALVSLLASAGCLEGPTGESTVAASLPVPASAVASDPASPVRPAALPPPIEAGETDPGVAVLRPGSLLQWPGECPCPLQTFTVDADGWGGWLEVRVRWDGSKTPGFETTLLAADGRSVDGERGFDDRLIRVWSPASGTYGLTSVGSGAFVATARFASLDIPADGPLLPNLVEQVIEGPHVGFCDATERAEQGAIKCMRFGNGVANPGHGPVQIRLTVDEAASALLPLDGRFVQEIRHADGSVEQVPVGPAEFHLAHGHWHYDGLAVFELFAVDAETGLRGSLAASHGKSGFCFLDWDRMVENVTVPAERERAETDCLVPGVAGSWTNGISRGWYDFYSSGLSDQYVDIAGLPDGLYELVASADPLGTLRELDETDNQSSLLLRIAGNDIEVLEERGHFRVQEDDDA